MVSTSSQKNSGANPGFLQGILNAVSSDMPRAYEEEVFRVKQFDDNNISLAKITRKKIIEEYKNSINTFHVFAVLGELSSIDLITEAIACKNCESINIVIGPKFRSEEIKNKVTTLLNGINSDRLHIKSLNDRPDYHAVMIGDSLFIEDPHEENKDYLWATFIPDANEISKMNFMEVYKTNEGKTGKMVIKETIKEIDAIDKKS